MFWNFATTSNIDSILEKEDVTLYDLLEDDDVLQECKGQNTKLVEFLCQPIVMEELVSLIVIEPASEADEALKYKYPNVACEILTSDVPQINDVLGNTESLQERLFSFLDNEPVLNPLLASFFSRVVGILLSRKPEPTLQYIKTKNEFLGSVLKHLGTSAIMDLLLRLVTCVEAADLRAQVLSWLNENKVVEQLIGLIDPAIDNEFHCNSAQSLCDIIRLSREHMYTMQESAQEDPLLKTLERKETVQLLLQHMFDKEINESVIINGISVILALLEIRRPAPFGFPEMAPELTQLDVERLACGVSKTLHGLSDRLNDFHKLLEHPPPRQVMHCTFGELNPPLGNTRLHVGKLISAILITNTHNINVQLSELQIFNALLDLFFQYEYNNFLHTQVVQCIQTVLSNAVTVINIATYDGKEGEEDDSEKPRKMAPLLTHLFEDCRLIQRILDAWEDNRVHETEAFGHRKGNMGHLTIITNQIVENMEKGVNAEKIKVFFEGMPEEDQGRWQKFVGETLSEMNEKNSRELGGHNPMHFSSDDEGETDYRDIPFSLDSAQQAFTDYQLQQITSNFIDQFGFTDGDFADQDDVDIKFNKINSIDFSIKADTESPNQDLFESVCRARLPSFGDGGDGEEKKLSEEVPVNWSITNNTNADSPYKYGNAPPTITVRTRSNSSDGAWQSDGAESDSTKSALPKIQECSEEIHTHQPDGWRTTFGDGISDDSNNRTSHPSPHTESCVNASFEATSLSSNSENKRVVLTHDDWARFDILEDLIKSRISEENTGEFQTYVATASIDPESKVEVEGVESKDKPRCENMGAITADAVNMDFQDDTSIVATNLVSSSQDLVDADQSTNVAASPKAPSVEPPSMEANEVSCGNEPSKDLSQKQEASRLTNSDQEESKSDSILQDISQTVHSNVEKEVTTSDVNESHHESNLTSVFESKQFCSSEPSSDIVDYASTVASTCVALANHSTTLETVPNEAAQTMSAVGQTLAVSMDAPKGGNGDIADLPNKSESDEFSTPVSVSLTSSPL